MINIELNIYMNNINKHINPKKTRMLPFMASLLRVLTECILMMSSSAVFGQVVHNTGAKITVTQGTYVESDTFNNASGNLLNKGVINLKGDYINAGTTGGFGTYNLKGSWFNSGIFNPDTSTVRFLGNINQTISSSSTQNFYRLIIDNSGTGTGIYNRILLLNNVEVTKTLRLNQGIINANTNTLYLSDKSILSLDYTSTTGTRVIGKFERGVNQAGEYLFPVGAELSYNPVKLNFNESPTAGSVLSEFHPSDPGDLGVPFDDLSNDSVEIYDIYNDGYWGLAARNGFVSNDYNIRLNGSGFATPVYDVTHLVKRPFSGNWSVDGMHVFGVDPVVARDNLIQGIAPADGHEFGFGQPRPRIWQEPTDTAVCEGESAGFSLIVTGHAPLRYQWQVNDGNGWTNLSDNEMYSGTDSSVLNIATTNLGMDGYKYRVVVTHKRGNFNTSFEATLYVNPIPVATFAVKKDTICNNETTHIEFFSDVPGSSFELEVVDSGNIVGASNLLVGDTIIQSLNNPTQHVDSVIYRIIPTGPNTTFCLGYPDTMTVYVNPTPEIEVVVDDTLCYGEPNTPNIISITQPNTVKGKWLYDLDVTYPAGVNGVLTDSLNLDDLSLLDNLVNTSDDVQEVTYHFTPHIDIGDGRDCGSGIDTLIRV